MEDYKSELDQEQLTDKEKDIRREAFLVGYGTALQETKEILEGIIDEIGTSLEGIKKQLEPEKQNETKQDEGEK